MEKIVIELTELLKVLLPDEKLSDVLAETDRIVYGFENGGVSI